LLPKIKINPKLAVVAASFGIVWILQILFLRHGLEKKRQTNEELQNHMNEINFFVSKSPFAPTLPNIEKLTSAFDELKNNYEKLLSLLDTSTRPEQNLTPLEFKENLLKTEQLLRERADLRNIRIPSALGFDEFEGGHIPAPQDIPDLAFQLDALQTIVNHLIESDVSRITRIRRKALRDVALPANRVMYRMSTFEIAMEGSQRNFQTALEKIGRSNNLFIVRRVDMESDSRLVSVNLEVDAIRLRKK